MAEPLSINEFVERVRKDDIGLSTALALTIDYSRLATELNLRAFLDTLNPEDSMIDKLAMIVLAHERPDKIGPTDKKEVAPE